MTEFTRRKFLAGVGATVAVGSVLSPHAGAEEAEVVADRVLGPGPLKIAFRVNGKPTEVAVEPRVTLLDCLRTRLDLTGAKPICDRGACGGCTVLLDGRPVNSCLLLAVDASGRDVTTVEGLAPEGELTPLQRAFCDHDALQCGYCTPGMVVAAPALLAARPRPPDPGRERGLSGNICRCGTYVRIREAIRSIAPSGEGSR